ncbi:hypothetical protein [Thiohalorhabdus methylotrophus]|uniref:Glycine zipper domain-containing protein n=1 Tax=Thiohalorhabdus methylotrophus TaxID=3242694 RepID=A0ABV4TVK0_9GAMM
MLNQASRGSLPAILVAWLLVLLLAGCQNLPGTRQQQTTAGGAAAGAALGAMMTENNVTGALLGGALGGGGGYLLGGESRDEDDARQAAREAQSDPVTAAQVEEDGDTVDINDNGFVTMDEVIAMEEAGLSDEEIIDRLEATD